MTAFLTTVSFKPLEGDPGVARVSTLNGTALYGDRSNALRVSTVNVDVLYSERTNNVRLSTLNVYALVSLKETLTPAIIRGGRIDTPVLVSGVNTLTQDPSLLEPNPYKPTLPTDVTDGMTQAQETHAQSQQEMLRKQHNLTQAGDSTFPWDLIQQSTDAAQFNLGSVGRFFTQSVGIVHAVYVKFVKIAADFEYGQMPYGRLKSSTGVDWTVTNDFSLSGADLAVGIGMMDKLPANGQYGWLVIRGGTIASLQPYDFSTLSPDDIFTWGTTGTIRKNGSGKILARVWGTPTDTLLNPGDLYIDVGGMSPLELENLFSGNFDQIATDIDNLQQAVEILQETAQQGDYSAAISRLNQAVALLSNSLDRESATRSSVDAQLRALIGQGQVSVGDFNDYKTQVANQFQDILNQLQTLGRTVQNSKIITDQLNPTAINNLVNTIPGQITTILAQIAALQSGTSRFPLVTGEVPPVFVYLDDGSLVYVEV